MIVNLRPWTSLTFFLKKNLDLSLLLFVNEKPSKRNASDNFQTYPTDGYTEYSSAMKFWQIF